MNIEVILLREPPVWLDFLLKGTADGISSVSPFVERLVRFTWGPFEPLSDSHGDPLNHYLIHMGTL